MNRQELAWKRFEQTGSISAYLAYRQSREYSKTEGDLQYADIYRRHRSENETAGK